MIALLAVKAEVVVDIAEATVATVAIAEATVAVIVVAVAVAVEAIAVVDDSPTHNDNELIRKPFPWERLSFCPDYLS